MARFVPAARFAAWRDDNRRVSAYAVVTPVRNEAAGLRRLISSVVAQTARPQAWLLIENGSSDGTADIARRLAAGHPWIRIVEAEPAGDAERGGPIIHAFHEGLAQLGELPPVVVQLDADLTLPADYFERLLGELRDKPALGIVSGSCYEQVGGEWTQRHLTGANVWGAARAYRRECLEQVLPLEPRTGWDAIDVAEANALGWTTQTLLDLPFFHHRAEGSRERTRWSAWAAQGRVSHYIGYRPSYLVVRALFRAVRDPSALALLAGYFGNVLRREPRCNRPALLAWVRRQQRLRHLLDRAAEARGARLG